MKKLVGLLTTVYFVFYAITYISMCNFAEQNVMGKVIITITVMLALAHVVMLVKPALKHMISIIKSRKAKNYLVKQIMFLI